MRNSESIYRDLIENIRDIVYAVDNNGIITYLSPSIRSIGGYDPTELIGRNFSDLVYKDDKATMIGLFGRYLAGLSGPSSIDARLIIKSGDIRWARISVQPINDEQGFKGVRGVLSDITENKKAEEALRESEERYRAVWDNSPVGICLTDKDGIYRFVNPAYCRIYGYQPEELVGEPFYKVIAPDNIGNIRKETHNRLFDEGKAVPLGESEFIRKDGCRLWVEYTADFVRKDGIPIYLVSMNVDITDRKMTELALKESEEKYRLLIDNAQDSILLVEQNGSIFLLNKKAANYLQGQPDDFTGRNIRDLFPHDAAENRIRLIGQVIRQNSIVVREESIHFNGEQRWFQTNLHPIFSYRTGIRGVQIISRDITDDKKKAFRTSARIRLLENLRNAENAERCLQYGCDAIYDSMYFKRSGAVLFGEDDNPSKFGQRTESENMDNLMKYIRPGRDFYRSISETTERISQSYIIDNSDLENAGLYVSGVNRTRNVRAENAYLKENSNLLIPMLGENRVPIGWVLTNSHFEKEGEFEDIVSGVEEVVEIITQHIREMQGRVKLKEEQHVLERTNVALTEVMASIEEEKGEQRERIIENIDNVILPLLEKVDNQGRINRTYFDQLKVNLKALASSPEEPQRNIAKLTSREMEICDLIKVGSSNKIIAESIAISVATVKKHRESIRRKLGLNHREVNLTTYLQNM